METGTSNSPYYKTPKPLCNTDRRSKAAAPTQDTEYIHILGIVDIHENRNNRMRQFLCFII
jgi:hypothetical protein